MKLQEVLAIGAFLGMSLVSAGCRGRIPIEIPAPAEPSAVGVRLVAHPYIIHAGEAVVLRWNAPNHMDVTLEQAIDPAGDIRAEFRTVGTFPPEGTLEVYPLQSVSYIVSCGNDVAGCYSAAIHITVK